MASASLSVNAPAFVPGMVWPPLAKTPAWESSPQTGVIKPIAMDGAEVDDHIRYLQDIIAHVSTSPGNFEEYMQMLVETLNNSLREPRQLSDIADIVFDQSVLEPNFTYTGAKMCEYLHKNLVLTEDFGDFRRHINKRAKDICVNRKVMVKHPEDIHRLRGATTFLTELFLTAEIVVDGKEKKIDIYRQAQKQLMETLSCNPTSENFKCLGQIFKLAGKVIEDYDRDKENHQNKFSTDITKVFNNAKNVLVEGELERDVRQMWLQLIERRASDWGRIKASPLGVGSETSTPTSSPGMTASADMPFTNEPVFYGPGGKIISAADAGFGGVDFENEYEDYEPGDGVFDQYVTEEDNDYKELEEAIAAATLGPAGDFSGMPGGFDDWDPEVEAAFEEFQAESAKGLHANYR